MKQRVFVKVISLLFFTLLISNRTAEAQPQFVNHSFNDTSKAVIYYDSANIYYNNNEYTKAKQNYQAALEIYKSVFGINYKKVSHILRRLGIIEDDLGNIREALNIFLNILRINDKFYGEGSVESAKVYNDIAIEYIRLEMFDSAEYFLNKDLINDRKLFGEESKEVANIYNNYGLIYNYKGDFYSAAEYYKKALDIRLKIGSKHDMNTAQSYNNLAFVYYDMGDYDEAINYQNKALKIQLSNVDEIHPRVAWSYNNLGCCYFEKVDYTRAFFYQAKALAIRLKLFGEEHPDVQASYMNIANIYEKLEKYDSSLYFHHKALDVCIKTLGPNHSDVASIYYNMGNVYYNSERYDSALINYTRAIDKKKSTFSRPNPLISDYYIQSSDAYLATGQIDKVKECIDSAIVYNTSLIDIANVPDSIWLKHTISHLTMYRTLMAKAGLESYKADTSLCMLQKALFYCDYALQELINSRFEITTESSKLLIGENIYEVSSKAMNLLYKLYKLSDNETYIERAFYFSEKAKASLLYESLTATNVLIKSGLSPQALQQEKNFLAQISFYETQQKTDKDTENIDSILFALRYSYRNFLDSINKVYPLMALIKKDIKIIDTRESRNSLHPSGALIEYFTSKEKSYAIAITPEKQSFIELPTDTSLAFRIKKFLSGIRKNNPELTYTNGKWLYKTIIEPVLPVIKGAKELLIVPDQALSSIPFEGLISGGNINKPSFLIENFSLSYQNSASIWYERNKLPAGKNYTRSNLFDFIGFAPVFKSNNDYAALREEGFTERYGNDTVFFESFGNRSYFRELPNSNIEVNEIAGLFGKANLKAKVFTYEQASKDTFREKSPNCKILHVATHAYADNDNPELSWLAFAQTDTSVGKNNDGILYAGEIYGLSLKADLAVLSACETGIGKVVKGEGVMSISRSIMYAGVPNIIISLWKVGDLDTRLLMVEFYKAYLSGKKYSDALRAAKLMMLKKSPDNPKSWAGFVLFGT